MSQENIKTVLDTTAASTVATWIRGLSIGRTTSTTGRSKVRSMTKAPSTARTLTALTCRTGSTLTFAVLYTIRDGKIARGCEYMTRDEALEAAGLSE
jgi:hypothetical protein